MAELTLPWIMCQDHLPFKTSLLWKALILATFFFSHSICCTVSHFWTHAVPMGASEGLAALIHNCVSPPKLTVLPCSSCWVCTMVPQAYQARQMCLFPPPKVPHGKWHMEGSLLLASPSLHLISSPSWGVGSNDKMASILYFA